MSGLNENLVLQFFICSNSRSDIKSFNEDHVADYNLGCLLLFSPLFISFFYVIPILQNVEKSV